MPQNTPSRAQAAQQAADTDTPVAENASLRDRMLRALAEAENTRRRADGAALDASRFAIADFARGILDVADNLQRTRGAVEQPAPGTADEAALVDQRRARWPPTPTRPWV
jgi:molecular chaperone GrpE